MAEHSKIEWTDATWNVITGCSVLSPGCTNCYAMKLAGTRLKNHPTRAGLTIDTKTGPVWNGEVRFNREWLHQPLQWQRPRMIFVCAHGDLFHESVPDEVIIEIYGVMVAAVHLNGHTLQVLTKRSHRMRELLNREDFWEQVNCLAADHVMERVDPLDRRSDDARATLNDYGPNEPPPGIWHGISAEDQARADERIPDLLLTPSAVRWVSAEPLIGPVDLTRISTMRFRGAEVLNALTGELSGIFGDPCMTRLPRLDWVVPGGESGPDARPMHPDWPRSLRDQCVEAGVAFLFKQWGGWVTYIDRDVQDPDWRQDYRRMDESKTFRWLNLAGGRGFHGERFHVMQRVGKKIAGRLLDGREWNELPKVAV